MTSLPEPERSTNDDASRFVLVERHGPVRVVVLNRPEKRNAFDLAGQRRVLEALDEVAAEDGVRALVLTGAGSAFCAGADRAVLMAAAQDPRGSADLFAPIQAGIIDRLLGYRFPTIAVVNGPAAGFGATLAALCDFVLASEEAVLWDPHVLHGLPGSVVLQAIWGRHAPLSFVKEALMTGRKIDAEEALARGLFNRVYPIADLRPAAIELAGTLAALPGSGVEITRRMCNRSLAAEVRELMGEVLELKE
jgi:enoyl-CoA hydratase